MAKIRPSSLQMASMRNRSGSTNRSKVVKILPGQGKPSKIQIFKKKPSAAERRKKAIEEKKRKDLELIQKQKEEEEKKKKEMANSLPNLSQTEEKVGGMLKGFNLRRTRTPACKLKDKIYSKYFSSSCFQ